jgi:hypothetical protein
MYVVIKFSLPALNPCFQAYCIFWVEIGQRMGIQNIPETPEEMRAWARVSLSSCLLNNLKCHGCQLQAYEKEHMVPHPINHEVAGYTTEELLYAVPTAFRIRDWVEGLTVCMLDEPVRIAML